jgi:pSer/pThr/pTyr-binding forkhead associated (FHA) protein
MSPDDSPPDPAAGPSAPDADTTNAVPVATLRLADLVAGDPPLPVALLLVVQGEPRGAVLAVHDLPVVIGRSIEADVVIADETVSRQHARLEGDRGALVLADLGSSNGTTLNGNPMAGEVTLHDGDLVGFGEAVVVVKTIS